EVVCTPAVVVGLAAMYWRHEMMFICGRQGTANSSHRKGLPGPSWRRMRMMILRCDWPLPSVGAAGVIASVTGGFITGIVRETANGDKYAPGAGQTPARCTGQRHGIHRIE